ncbi:MAG TPA: GntR family transcriptional regulator [Anaerolineales bacterium]|nr:GntR family transcriptional regulator [Anaerolineales bacterium]
MKIKSSPNLSGDVFMALKERIIHWHYPPGYRFTEEGLCEEFGVSRSPVREALRMLVENGLVDKEPHKGYSVKQPDMREIHELYEVRLALELYVVASLIKTGMPNAEWQRLYDVWQAILDKIPENVNDFSEQDEEFHEALAELAHNKILMQQLRSIDERLHFIRVMDITTSERLRSTCKQHIRILECIKDGDVDCAREALEMNIQDGRENVEQAVKTALAKSYMGI